MFRFLSRCHSGTTGPESERASYIGSAGISRHMSEHLRTPETHLNNDLDEIRRRLGQLTDFLSKPDLDGHTSTGLQSGIVERRRDPRPEVDLSFVVPVFDEAETIEPLFEKIRDHVPGDHTFEVIYVDDGSRDGTWDRIKRLRSNHRSVVRGLRLGLNSGKATALAAGFRVTHGKVVFTLDGDLQDDPSEIPRFLSKLHEGYDLVSGWKKVRHDPWHKVLPSRVFNRMLSYFGGVKLHDHNCGFKCYRGHLARKINLHGELHRMVPCLAGMLGYRCAEIEIQHHPRTKGRSKYGVERFLRGFSDMLTIGFLRNYRHRPTHFFNSACGGYLFTSLALAAWTWWQPVSPTITVLKLLAAFLFAGMGAAVFLAGLICELVLRGPVSRNRNLPVAEDTGFSTTDPPVSKIAAPESIHCDLPISCDPASV